MGYLNHNFRFNSEKDEDTRAWEILHSEVVKDNFKSQNTFVIKAINEYYDRVLKTVQDPLFTEREKEDRFAERIVEAVESKVVVNLPALAGMYMSMQQCIFGQGGTGTLSGTAFGIDTEIVNEYREKFSQYPQGILNGIVQAQSARAIKEILKEDIDSWVKENGNSILYASESGMRVFDRIDAESEEAIAYNEYGTPEERLQAKTKAFFEAEKRILPQIDVDLRKHYQLYSKLRDVRQAYIDLLGMSEDELRNFNDSIGILTTKELSELKESQKNEKHVLIEHIDPNKFLQKHVNLSFCAKMSNNDGR